MSFISKLLALFGFGHKAADSPQNISSVSPMNEGDFHSGPGGYTPSAGYSDTFYGSGEYLLGEEEEGSEYSGGTDEGGFR